MHANWNKCSNIYGTLPELLTPTIDFQKYFPTETSILPPGFESNMKFPIIPPPMFDSRF